MAKMDWKNSDVVKAEDMNQIGREINQLHTEWKDRLDTADTDPVTLQPGVQMVHATKDARFRLGEIKGRTLINVLGDSGSCDSLQGWSDTGRFTIDTTNKVEGSASIKGTLLTGDPYVDLNQIIRYQPSKFYVAIGEVKVPSGVQARLRMVESERPETERASEVILSSTGDKFKTLFFKVPQNAFSESGTVYFGAVFVGSQGSTGNVDALRIYEISASEYDSLNGMTAEQVAAKYPFVPSGIVGVDSPYVIGYGENLLPPLYENSYIVTGYHRVTGPYTACVEPSSTSPYQYSYVPFKVKPNTEYTLSLEGTNFYHAIFPTDLMVPNPPSGWSTNSSVTFNSGENSELLFLFRNAKDTLPAEIKNPMITIGRQSKPFKPRRDTMLALQTELNANPIDGSDPDVLYEKEGHFFRLAKWKRVVWDGSQNWTYFGSYAGFKSVFYEHRDSVIERSGFGTKYDGKYLPEYWGSEAPDEITIDHLRAYTWIRNEDSGWGEQLKMETFSGDGMKKSFTLTPPAGLYIAFNTFDVIVNGIKTTAYTFSGGTSVLTFTTAPEAGTNNIVISYIAAYVPSSDEIKAYFMGWKMFLLGQPTNVPYTGTGTKGWAKLTDTNIYTHGYMTSVPSVTFSGFTPYQLIYRLAKDYVEPVVSEGALSLHEGNNLVEVGTGIVLREGVEPSQYIGSSGQLTAYLFNTLGYPSLLRNKTDKIFAIYKDNRDDTASWGFRYDSTYGKVRADIPDELFDTSAVYSTTYTKLDKSPIQPISGILAANEKAQISDLTAGVAEALQRVSVVEQKKADGDAPGWITPTLLNGWVPYSDGAAFLGYPTIQYRKDSQGFVHLRGLAKKGTGSPSILFYLPEGYRPTQSVTFVTICYSGTLPEQVTRVRIGTDGAVTYMYGPVLSEPASWLSLNIPTFTLD